MPKTLKGFDAVAAFRNSSKGQVVLVLQGGGALGAYQVGERDDHPRRSGEEYSKLQLAAIPKPALDRLA
jgi:hypothetical protein